MSNSDSGAPVVTAMLRAIASAYGWPGYVTSLQPRPESSQDAVDQVIGDYELRPGFQLSIKQTSTGLMLTVQGQPPLNLIAADDGTWMAREVDVVVRFDEQVDQSPVLVLRQNGAELRAPLIRS